MHYNEHFRNYTITCHKALYIWLLAKLFKWCWIFIFINDTNKLFFFNTAHESDARRRMISKSFHHQLKVSERQAVTGPPESMREHVVAASKAMRNGLWHQAYSFIINEKMNAKVIQTASNSFKSRFPIISKGAEIFGKFLIELNSFIK